MPLGDPVEVRRRPARVYWLCQIAGWTTWTVLNLALVLLRPGAGGKDAPGVLWLGATGLAASHALRLITRRRGLLLLSPAALVPRLIALVLALAAVLTGVNLLAMIYVFGVFSWGQTRLAGYVYSMALWAVVLAFWASIYVAVHSVARHRQSEIETLRLLVSVRDAQLGMMRAQLNPHFMFNCLNSIRALVTIDPDRAQSAITELSHLLREALQSERASLVTLRHEMDMVSQYLKLEHLRYEDRLRVSTTLDPASLDRRVPPMLVQTLVENAVKHGIARLPQGGAVRVETACDGADWVLRVVNTGTLRELQQEPGVGLANARRRLQLLYGAHAELSLTATTAGEVVAEVRITGGETGA
jgi:hypothetical protein